MICNKCGKRIKKTLIKCPFCNERIINKVDFDLPQLKEEHKTVQEDDRINQKDEIIEITPGDYDLSNNSYGIELKDENNDSPSFDTFAGIENESTSNNTLIDEDLLLGETKRIVLEDESSLMDDISREIDNMSNESSIETINSAKQEDAPRSVEIIDPTSSTDEETINDEYAINSSFSVKKRQKIFIISLISMIMLAIIVVTLYRTYVTSDHNNTKIPVRHEQEITATLNEALDNYYINQEVSQITEILENVKNDEDKVKEFQNIVKNKGNDWVTQYYEMDVSSREEFETLTLEIKELLNILHAYGTVKKDDKTVVQSLTNEDFTELMQQVNEIYEDSAVYFDALAFYNQKDYNKAYTSFDKIDSENKYYSKAKIAKSKVINSILDLLQNDIEKISKDISSLNDEEKLSRYIQIEEIIYEYRNVYYAVDLEGDETYKELLSKYSNLVSETENIVADKKATTQNTEIETTGSPEESENLIQ